MDIKQKIVLIGDGGVGKTSIVHRWVDEKFQNKYIATIGVDVLSKSIAIDGNNI